MLKYVVEYEACALIFLIIVTVRFFCIRKYPSRLNTLFAVVLYCAIADIALDIASTFFLTYPDVIPLWLNYLTNTSFYTLQVVLPVLVLVYVLNMCNVWHGKYRLLWLSLAVAVLLILYVVNPFTKCIYSLVPTESGLELVHGAVFPLLFITCGIYLLASVVVVLKYKERIRKIEMYTILLFVTVVFLSIVIQIFLPNVLLTGVAISASITMMFFTMQNPEAMLDLVSGVFNYSALHEYLKGQTAEKRGLWVTAVDIGGIRRINSVYGLRSGNKIMRQAGDYLNKACGNNAMAFQMIGTKFLIISNNKKAHYEIINDVSTRFTKPWNIGDLQIKLIATIRYSEEPSCFSSSEDVTNLVDLAYAKAVGDEFGTTKPIGSALLEQSRRNMSVEEALRRALDTGRGFSLKFQPIYSIKEKGFCSAEALLRLTDAELGSISPAEFIPVAEKTGQINRIDGVVLDMACAFLRKHEELFSHGFRLLEINLSAAEFYHDTTALADEILKKIDGLESKICFEVTETAATTHRELLSDFMDRLIARKVLFAIDDFGTGFANITQLARLPFSIAKLDRSLIATEREKERIILNDVVNMFAHLGLETVVEGVETEDQALLAEKFGADEVQGYFFSYPLSEEEFVAKITEQEPR